MTASDCSSWLAEFCAPSVALFAKRLSGNDTLTNGSHQAGPYIPKEFLFHIFPMINRTDVKNPDHWFKLTVDSHLDERDVRVIYYNSKRHEGKRNGRDETRLTNFGGKVSPLLDPESTGVLAIFAFIPDVNGHVMRCHVWVCRQAEEEAIAEERLGPVDPGHFTAWLPGWTRSLQRLTSQQTSCHLERHEIPQSWLIRFPSGAEIVRKTVELRGEAGLTADQRLMRRRECEFEIFRCVEEAIELPAIRKGFSTLDEFIEHAQTVLQRRKARSGRSLELHTREILIEEQLGEGTDFVHGAQSENGKRPDFLFPSAAAYHDPAFPVTQLRMLAAKTTCRDRWRQILNEADRIPVKHLLTLQEGVSESQFREMEQAKVQLVVPKPLIERFPKTVRSRIQTLESFIADIRMLRRKSM